jgi:myosin heavy subunit
MSKIGFAEAPIVFIKDDVEAWIIATVKEKSKTEAICRIRDGEERIVRLKDFKNSELPKVNREVVADLVNMKYLHEPGVLVNLISRLKEGKPYTRSRDVIISMNPFRWLEHLYTETTQKYYARKIVWQISKNDPRRGLEPHIYEVSSLSYAELAFRGNNQSILITGESGSGKTEAAKLIMHHIASIQLGPSKETQSELESLPNSRSSSGFSDVVDRILHTNPLLEAFGNSLTAQNENSSRFGKYVQLQFDKGNVALESYRIRTKPDCILVGSICEVYLLETSRVCIHASNERSYHIFYQLLAAPDTIKSSIWNGIVGKTASDFKYTGIPIAEKIDGVTDYIKFNETWSAFTRIGIAERDTTMLLQAVCLVLQLGNVEFSVNCDDKVVLLTHSEFSLVSNLLGVSADQLLLSFTERTMTTRNETFKVPLSVSSTCEARDALAKDIYLRSFNWLVDTINSITGSKKKKAETHDHDGFGIIGILDIFGFESFTINRFEQLCINYANEKLQQKAINDIFCAVRDEYEYEGIPLDLVEVVSNEELLHLFESRTGLIALLNEESYLPKGNSKAFTTKVIENFRASSHIISPPVGVTNQFGIVHYAGTVVYTTDNFLIGNQDTLPLDLKSCVSKSSNPIVAGRQTKNSSEKSKSDVSNKKVFISGTRGKINNSRFTDGGGLPTISMSFKNEYKTKNLSIGKKWELTQAFLKSKQSHEVSISSRGRESQSFLPWNDKANQKNPQFNPSAIPSSTTVKAYKTQSSSCDIMATTVWTKYRTQLSSLVEKLSETHSRYVRCIKPNKAMSPMTCDHHMIIKQLRYTGIVSTVKLSQALFANSIPNKILSTKYRFLWDRHLFPCKAKRIDTCETRRKLECEALLDCAINSVLRLNMNRNTTILYSVGKTRSYFRQGILEALEARRLSELARFATVIQRKYRRIYGIDKRRKTIESTHKIQKWYRKAKSIQLKNLSDAATRFQKIFRGYLTRQKILKIIAATTIQLWYRMNKLKVATLRVQKMKRLYKRSISARLFDISYNKII